MILIITSKTDYTADFLILELRRLEIAFVRLNTEDFPEFIDLSLEFNCSGVTGQIIIDGRCIALEEIRSIWYRRPGVSIPSAEVTAPEAKEFVIVESRETLEGLWRILPCFWVSHPDKLRIAESKFHQLVIASRLGFVIPDTLVTNSPNTLKKFHEHSSPLIYKPLRRGQISHEDSTGNIYTSIIKPEHIEHFDTVHFAPGLFQPYIRKMFELRVTVVGSRVFAVEIHSQEVNDARTDWRRVDPVQLRHVPHELPEDIAQKCISLVKALGLAFGAIDLIVTPEGDHIFLEINPNGQWAWIEQICPEVHIRAALIDLLVSGNGG